MHLSKPVWTERNNFVKLFLQPNSTILDYGCGDKDILNYINASEYLGIDKVETADIVTDLDKFIPNFSKTYDYGLVLGVLEYLKSPYDFLDKIKHTANTIVVLCLIKKVKKEEWAQHFYPLDLESNLKKIFKSVSVHRHNSYYLFICNQ